MENATKSEVLPRNFTLPVGIFSEKGLEKEVELLRSNGMAEKIFTSKQQSKPYTWMGEVISIATKYIGSNYIGDRVREEYSKSKYNTITIPKGVLDLSLADVNTMIVEIHRRSWKNLIPEQKVNCQKCGKTLSVDIDLNLISLPEDTETKVQEIEKNDFELVVKLTDGFEYVSPIDDQKKKNYEEYEGLYTELRFKLPQLSDAIRNEKYAEDTVEFWRRVAFDCLIKVYSSELNVELPLNTIRMRGMKLFTEDLSSRDLSIIRETLRDSVPTMPFFYEEYCPCPKKAMIPVTSEASSFFSD